MNAGNDTPTNRTVSNRLSAFYPHSPIQTLHKQELYRLLPLRLLTQSGMLPARRESSDRRISECKPIPGLQLEIILADNIASLEELWQFLSGSVGEFYPRANHIEVAFAA